MNDENQKIFDETFRNNGSNLVLNENIWKISEYIWEDYWVESFSNEWYSAISNRMYEDLWAEKMNELLNSAYDNLNWIVNNYQKYNWKYIDSETKVKVGDKQYTLEEAIRRYNNLWIVMDDFYKATKWMWTEEYLTKKAEIDKTVNNILEPNSFHTNFEKTDAYKNFEKVVNDNFTDTWIKNKLLQNFKDYNYEYAKRSSVIEWENLKDSPFSVQTNYDIYNTELKVLWVQMEVFKLYEELLADWYLKWKTFKEWMKIAQEKYRKLNQKEVDDIMNDYHYNQERKLFFNTATIDNRAKDWVNFEDDDWMITTVAKWWLVTAKWILLSATNLFEWIWYSATQMANTVENAFGYSDEEMLYDRVMNDVNGIYDWWLTKVWNRVLYNSDEALWFAGSLFWWWVITKVNKIGIVSGLWKLSNKNQLFWKLTNKVSNFT